MVNKDFIKISTIGLLNYINTQRRVTEQRGIKYRF